jgi:hypothetical protein
MPINANANELIFDDLYGSRYFSASDLHGETPRHRIGKVEIAELKDQNGTTKKKMLVYLNGVEKPLVLNKTNATKLAAAFGKDSRNWIGVYIELYSEMTSLGKEGVRLRPLKKPTVSSDPISSGPVQPSTDMDDAIPFAAEFR